MNKKIDAEITFENIGDFEFVENGSEDNELTRKYFIINHLQSHVSKFFNVINWNELGGLGDAIYRKKTVRIQAQDGTPVSFLIRPTTLGNIDLRLTAKTSTAGDSVVRQLLVKVSQQDSNEITAITLKIYL